MFDVKVTTTKASTDCGAACMVSFLAYYGVDVDLETARKECNIKVGGCTGKDLLVCGRKHGLDMIPWGEDGIWETDDDARKTDVDVIEQDRPSICWWQKRHWVICCGLDDNNPNKVVIMNPSRGRYSISKSLFKAFYSGLSITNGIPERLPETTE